jgi:hypothetical protein
LLQYCQLVRNPNFTLVRDANQQNLGYQGTRVFVYDDMKSLEVKVSSTTSNHDIFFRRNSCISQLCTQANYIRQKLAGYFLMSLEKDDAANECGCGEFPYLRTMSELVNGRECILRPCF